MKLLVRNLDRATTSNELNDLFKAYGKIQSCNVIIDPVTKGSKGFGFVEMPKAGEAKAALKNLNNKSEQEVVILAKQIYLLYESAVAESHLHRDSWPISSAKVLCEKILI